LGQRQDNSIRQVEASKLFSYRNKWYRSRANTNGEREREVYMKQSIHAITVQREGGGERNSKKKRWNLYEAGGGEHSESED
jgi:hypothetical protein